MGKKERKGERKRKREKEKEKKGRGRVGERERESHRGMPKMDATLLYPNEIQKVQHT